MTPERKDALWKADRALDRPYADPDDDLAVVSRQLLRSAEEIDKLRAELEAARKENEARSLSYTSQGARLLQARAELEAVKAEQKRYQDALVEIAQVCHGYAVTRARSALRPEVDDNG